MGFLYILLCDNGRYYIGSCVNLELRLASHRRGNTPSTKNVRPLKLFFSQAFGTLSSARKAEYWLKKQKSRIIVEKIINEGRLRKSFD